MSLLKKFYESFKEAMWVYMPDNTEEAWMAVLYAIMSIDGWLTESEINYLNRILSTKSMFKGHDVNQYYEKIKDARTKITSKEMIDNSAKRVFPERIRQTLFSMAVEMVVIDGKVTADETEILYYLAEALELDRELSDNIIKVMLIRNSGNIPL